MKRIYIVMLFAALATITYAQTDDKGYQEGAWVLKGVTGLNMSQTAMANWSAGGENSIAGNAYLNASLTHKKDTMFVDVQNNRSSGRVVPPLAAGRSPTDD